MRFVDQLTLCSCFINKIMRAKVVKLLKYLWRTEINYLIFTGQIYPGQSPKSSIVAHRIHNKPKSASAVFFLVGNVYIHLGAL